MSEHVYLQEDEVVQRAVDALVEALGPIEAARFLTLPRQRTLDSVTRHHRWQDSLDKDQFFDQVFGVEGVTTAGES
jgi:hypothetical protein